MKTKKVLIILFLFVLVIGSVYYYNEQYKNVVDKTNNNDEVVKPETPVINKCIEGYECIDVDNTTYKFSIKRSIKVNNMFNYDTNENEAGTLKIDDDGILVFEDLTGKVIKKYDNIESKVISIDSTNDKCDLIYVAVTEDGKVYKTEEEDGLFSGEPFLMIPLEEEYSKISLYNESCDLKLIGLNKNNEVKDLLVNE
ncbi:MAG: hypothetical protein MSH48_04445 [Mollicutes bacterium]|nr:hypothetical protein [Mollicutes bacterium]